MILTGWPVNLKQKLSKKIAKNYLTFYAIKKKLFFCAYIKWLILAMEYGIRLEFLYLTIHENDGVNKTLLLLLCVSPISKRFSKWFDW